MSLDEELDAEVLDDEEPAAAEDDAEPTAGGPAETSGEIISITGNYNATEVNEDIFEELAMPADVVMEVQNTWAAYLRNAGTREAAGEAIYSAVFDALPSLQSHFKTPRAVMAIRLMHSINQIIATLRDPPALKVLVETLGFQHLELEITAPRVVIFRDAITDLLRAELGMQFNQKAKLGWFMCLNYVGGSYVFIRVKFSDRLRILAASWATANNKKHDELMEGEEQEVSKDEGETAGDAEQGAEFQDGEDEGAVELSVGHVGKQGESGGSKKRKGLWAWASGSKGLKAGSGAASGKAEGDGGAMRNASVPTTYNEMFVFNAAVMGFGGHAWMNEVLASFDTIVCNVSSSSRLLEECDLLSLRMGKYKGVINLAEYKAVMLASLRSLVPKEWNSAHEVAWSWLWENVERMIKALMGKPAQQQVALAKFLTSLDAKAQGYIRREVYTRFFALAPIGQDYFKQSTTRLHFISDRLVALTLEMYREPKKMVGDISALGLRHVGYGIPTDLFGPYVTACVQVVRSLTEDDLAEEAFRWSLGLISRMLRRVITEGSTIVMKAINANSAKQLRGAAGCAPRGKRAIWMLNITVGTQFISPLLWAVETGSWEAARAIIVDLLTIRADRDRYYFGMDTLFERHPDIVKRLCADAPALLPTLLDGLVWRSRIAESGQRRVNYYLKHLLVDAEGDFSQALEWLVDKGDPKIICHPVLVMIADLVWNQVAQRTFLIGKAWFLFTLCVFIFGQSILSRLDEGDHAPEVNGVMFACRAFIYIFMMGGQIYIHAKHLMGAVRTADVVRLKGIPIPSYLTNWQDQASLALMLFLTLMFCTEPILYCLGETTADTSQVFTDGCPEGRKVSFAYSVFSMCAMLFYFLLLCDLSVFSTQVSAFALVCGRVLPEVGLFLFALGFIIIAFASAVSSLEHGNSQFAGIPISMLSLGKITFGMFGSSYEDLHEDPMLLAAVFLYVIATVVFLLNMLIAQLNCSYQSTFNDMVGLARLNRGKIVVETMPSVVRPRWLLFMEDLGLHQRCQFGEGDIGLAGALQIREPAALNVTTVDMIRRFGGSTSPNAQWAEEGGEEEDDKFERLERLIEKAVKRMSSGKSRKQSASAAGSSSIIESTSSDRGDQKSESEHGSD